MRLIVVSDLHLTGSDDPLYRSLLNLMETRVQPTDTLVLAGDIFDLFVGNKGIFLDRYSEFTEVLKRAGERGLQVHYIEGNHDFQIRKAFEGIKGVKVHAHHTTLEIGGKKFFVAHGDTVDRSDYGYRVLRGFFRSPVMKAFIRLAPDSWIDRIGKHSSDQSRQRNQRILDQAKFQTERTLRLRKIYRNFAAERMSEGYDFVVLGHCHDLDEMKFNVGGRQGHYVNVGFPRVHGSFVSWSPQDPCMAREPMP